MPPMLLAALARMVDVFSFVIVVGFLTIVAIEWRDDR